jgi:hypothetical protein
LFGIRKRSPATRLGFLEWQATYLISGFWSAPLLHKTRIYLTIGFEWGFERARLAAAPSNASKDAGFTP